MNKQLDIISHIGNFMDMKTAWKNFLYVKIAM